MLGALVLGKTWASTARAQGDRVYVNELLVLTFRYGDSNALKNRAQWIAAKFRKLRSESLLALKVSNNYVQILSGDEPILTVTPGEARAQRQSAEDLATTWLNNLRKALALPAIQITKDHLKLPVTGRSQVQVLGSEVNVADIQNSAPAVVEASKENGTISLRARAIGTATITVKGETSSDTLEVDVLPYAATLPQTVEVTVTGDPASAETVEGAVEGALATRLHAERGAELDYRLQRMVALPMEGSTVLTVPLRVSAPDAFPAEGKATVVVRNAPVSFKAEGELWYCNDPETIRAAGNLFASILKPRTPARMLYHHVNETGYPLAVRVIAVNEAAVPAQLLLIPGDSPPEKNPVLAGYKAGDQFLRNWISYSGEIVTIPPRSELPISMRRLYPGQTMSGLCYLRLMPGGPGQLLVRTDAMSPDAFDESMRGAFGSSTPWRVIGAQPIDDRFRPATLSRDIYPEPFKVQDVLYRVGGRYGFVRIGQKPIARADNQESLEGNFGVTYTIRAKVVNPTAEPVDVEVIFESSAGYTGALFVVNGTIVRIPLLQPKEESVITKLRLEPGEDRSLTILTIPLSGGSYPATVTIRPVGTLALVGEHLKLHSRHN
jgi:hypothetical protein